MKYLVVLGLLLIPSLAQAEPLDQREYMKARRQVAEVCQDLSFWLKHNPDADMESKMDECNPDYMEINAFEVCKDQGIEITDCPVTDLLFMDAGLLRLPMMTEE